MLMTKFNRDSFFTHAFNPQIIGFLTAKTFPSFREPDQPGCSIAGFSIPFFLAFQNTFLSRPAYLRNSLFSN
jgi:hypothetical protein